MTRGIELHHDGDLPARSGMGSSSAFTVGLLHVLHSLNGRMVSRQSWPWRASTSSRTAEGDGRLAGPGLAAYGGPEPRHVLPERGDLGRPVVLPPNGSANSRPT